MTSVNYTIAQGTIAVFQTENGEGITVDISGSFTIDVEASTESKVNVFLSPREPNSPVFRGFYYQNEPLRTEVPNVVVGVLAEYLAPCTIEMYWVQSHGTNFLTFSGATYKAINPPARLTGAMSGIANPA